MKASIDDVTFMDGMTELLGMEAGKINELLGKLDAQALMDLTDAVATGNKKAALKVVQTAEYDNGEHLLNPLLKGRDSGLHGEDDPDDDDGKAEAEDDAGDDERSGKSSDRDEGLDENDDEEEGDGDSELALGDKVIVRIGGKRMKATVKNPRAPGKTVGVLIKGKHKMVDRSDVKRMDEMVLGMTDMGSLARMQQLAGIMPTGSETPSAVVQNGFEVTYPDPEEMSSGIYDPMGDTDESGALSPVDQINAALDTVERTLPGVRLGEVSAIRKRIYAISSAMNESRDMPRAPGMNEAAKLRKRKF